MTEISVLRLYLLRSGYLLIAVGLGSQIWPEILHPTRNWELMQGVVLSMLGAMSALSVLGLRYPLKMLPLLFFELAWKSIWLLTVALPHWSADKLDAATTETAIACLMAVVFPIVIPWRYVIENYVTREGDAWRRAKVSA